LRLRRLLGGRLNLRRRARRGHSRHGRGWTAAAGEWPAVVTVRPSPSTTARLFGVDESALLFNRLLAYRGQAPEAMRAWLRDTYLAVARAVARGHSDQDIAAALQLSVATVHEHVSALHRLLGTSTRPRLVARLASGR
jgi:DNA-binding CsgD family transcriptional regulator